MAKKAKNNDPEQVVKKMKARAMTRAFHIDPAAIDEEARTVELAFSSETPVERWYGNEILDHSSKAVRLDRLRDGGPLLVDHDPRDHVGTIESVQLSADRVGRAKVRFGKSARAEEVFQDVIDGIRKAVSVVYRIYEMAPEERDEDGIPVSYRVTDWEPNEISFVSVPADHSVGVGRDAGSEENDVTIIGSREEPQHREESIMDPKDNDQSRQQVADGSASVVTQEHVDNARQQGEQAVLSRIKAVQEAGDEYARHNGQEVAREVIAEGGDVEAFNKRMLTRMGRPDATRAESAEVGMSEKEIKRYSMVRAMNALANPQDQRAQKAAAFEFEVSTEAARLSQKESRGILVPVDVLARAMVPNEGRRDLSVGTATAGGHTVATDLLSSSFIDLLRNRAMMMQPGMATVLTDLAGNIAIPRQTGGASGYWVAESSAPTESQQAFDQVTLSPETVGAYTEYSRKLLLQSSIDVEAFVRNDLARVLALTIDLAAINGTGTNNQPTGILNQTGIGSVLGGTDGAAPTWDNIVDLETEVAIDNADIGSLAYLTNAKVRGKLKKTFVDSGSNAERVWDTRAGNTPLNGYGASVTNQVPSDLTKGASSGVASAIIFGNFADLIIGMWGGLDITVNPYANDTSGGVRITALQDVDIAVRHPESFAAMKDALTS